ncbi:aminotransferase class I/II-fold pyridoxal phosphate-dependent enzyme [Mesorhizobium atlanticum]
MVFVCNPGNLTGTRIRNAELLRLRAGLPGDVLLMIDQAYGEFDDQDPQAVFALAGRGDTVVLRSLSKAYGLAGARVGWGLFAPQVAAELRKMQNSNQASTVSLAMAVAAVEDQAHMRATVARTSDIRDRFGARLARRRLRGPGKPDEFRPQSALPTRPQRRQPTTPYVAPTSSCAASPVTASPIACASPSGRRMSWTARCAS